MSSIKSFRVVPGLAMLAAAVFSCRASGQTDDSGPPAATAPAAAVELQTPPEPGTPVHDKRIFGVLPNYRTAENTDVEPLTSRQKFAIAAKDSFDWPSYILAGGLAGLSQLENSEQSFGQGLKGYAKRYAGGVGDQVVGNMMTEAIFPVWLKEDPRYFRKGSGSGMSRLGYAMSRVFVTRTDGGGSRFNYSEWVGNATTVAISNAYYRDNRDWEDNTEKLVTAVGIDMFSDILKEFWPDFKRRFIKRHHAYDSH
jgi:hypothetical protein